MWYDDGKTLTHNAMINQIIGPRGYGKTYALKKRAIRNFERDGSQFIYLRRYQNEIDLVKESLFSDILINEDIKGNFEYNQNCYTYNNEPCGWPMALSRSQYYKSASFPKVTLIIFDEYIIDLSQNGHYLKNEVRKFLDFVETIARMRENVKVFMLANSLSFINPYSIYWNLKQPTAENRIVKAVDGLVLLELVGDDEFKERKQKTAFGRLNAGTEYERMSVKNEFILDSDTFLEKRGETARYIFTLEYDKTKFGVWYSNRYYYIDATVDPSCKLIYTVTLEEHNADTLLLKNDRTGPFSFLIKAFRMGLVRFDSQRTKQAMYNIFKTTL